MQKLTVPIKGFTAENISQTYHTGHRALDIFTNGTSNGYGTPLCAPEDCEVLKITGDGLTEGNHALENGFGIFLKGLETGYSYLFWHTLPTLPVNVKDIVTRGQIIAYMGNSGNVYQHGTYIPLEKRNKAPFAGTHLHLEMFDKTWKLGKPKKFINPLLHLDYHLQPDYSVADQLSAIAIVGKKMLGLVSK